MKSQLDFFFNLKYPLKLKKKTLKLEVNTLKLGFVHVKTIKNFKIKHQDMYACDWTCFCIIIAKYFIYNPTNFKGSINNITDTMISLNLLIFVTEALYYHI